MIHKMLTLSIWVYDEAGSGLDGHAKERQTQASAATILQGEQAVAWAASLDSHNTPETWSDDGHPETTWTVMKYIDKDNVKELVQFNGEDGDIPAGVEWSKVYGCYGVDGSPMFVRINPTDWIEYDREGNVAAIHTDMEVRHQLVCVDVTALADEVKVAVGEWGKVLDAVVERVSSLEQHAVNAGSDSRQAHVERSVEMLTKDLQAATERIRELASRNVALHEENRKLRDKVIGETA